MWLGVLNVFSHQPLTYDDVVGEGGANLQTNTILVGFMAGAVYLCCALVAQRGVLHFNFLCSGCSFPLLRCHSVGCLFVIFGYWVGNAKGSLPPLSNI